MTEITINTAGKILLILIALLIPWTSWAQCTEEAPCPELARLSPAIVGGGVPAVAGETEETCTDPCVWTGSWTGSDEINTGTSWVWTKDDTSNYLSKVDSAGAGFSGDQSQYLQVSAVDLNDNAYLIRDITDIGSFGVRFGLYIPTGISDGSSIYIFMSTNLSGYSTAVRYMRTGATHFLRFYAMNSDSALTPMATEITISTATWYQVRLKFQKNVTADGAGTGFAYDVNSSVGEVGSGVAPNLFATKNQDTTQVYFGGCSAPSVGLTLRFDVFRLHNTYAFPDLYAW